MIRQFWTGDPGDVLEQMGELKFTDDLLPAFAVGVKDARERQRSADDAAGAQGVLANLRSKLQEMRESKHFTPEGRLDQSIAHARRAYDDTQRLLASAITAAKMDAAEIAKKIFDPLTRKTWTGPGTRGGHYDEEDLRALRAEVWRRWERIEDPMERENFYREAIEAGDGIAIGAIEQLGPALGGLDDELREAGRLHFAAIHMPDDHARWVDKQRRVMHLETVGHRATEVLNDVIRNALPPAHRALAPREPLQAIMEEQDAAAGGTEG